MIMEMEARDGFLTFNHALREGNICVDWLTNYGASYDVNMMILNAYPQ